MHVPLSTYRLQFNAQFTFADAEKILPYLKHLGISDIYSSPILQAQPLSNHGYDIIDHHKINEDLGGEKGFKHFVHKLHENQLQLILDIVPNHMAATSQNKAWVDVQRRGQRSPYAFLFDIQWEQLSETELPKHNTSPLYRRFFDVNELVCLHTENMEVFKHTHALLLRLIDENDIQGLRVDHVDGLRYSTAYLNRLASYMKEGYLIVEKILTPQESLPQEWPIAGTSGYDFLSQINQLFVNKTGLEHIIRYYEQVTQSRQKIEDIITTCIKQVIHQSFTKELNFLAQTLSSITNISSKQARNLLLQLASRMRRYRFYSPTEINDLQATKELITLCKNNRFLSDILLLRSPSSSPQAEIWRNHWEVFTAPWVIKGFEDTACYAYTPFIALNEVGMSVQSYSDAGNLEAFHAYNAWKQQHWPHSINATSTHDTKRSEDVRARLQVISELSTLWNQILERWLQQHTQEIPDTIDKILIYQTLLGAWPITMDEEREIFILRLHEYLIKAMRERKVHSCWSQPNLPYETQTLQFLDSLFEDHSFLKEFLPLQQKIAFYGMYHSLMQLVLKVTCPGVPDFYQGQETWRFDLVDPDNRRPVDYLQLTRLFSEASLSDLLLTWQNGQIKFNLIHRLLRLRLQYQTIFQEGQYIPLAIHGPYADHLCAFARVLHDTWIVVLTTRWLSGLLDVDEVWSSQYFTPNDLLHLPHTFHSGESVLTGKILPVTNKLSIAQLLADLPFEVILLSMKTC